MDHWSENKAIVIVGGANTKSVEVSESVKELGLDYIRISPFQARITSIPDINQHRYGDYLYNLSAFLYSFVHGIKTTNVEQAYPITYHEAKMIADVEKELVDPKDSTKKLKVKTTKERSPLLPFTPPPLIMAWPGGAIPEETMQQIRDTLTVQEGVSGGKPAVIYQPTNWDGYDKVKGYNVNPRATTSRGQINLKAVSSSRFIIAVLSTILRVHFYPAFQDNSHMNEVVGITEFVGEGDEEMDVDQLFRNPPDMGFRGDDTIALRQSKFSVIDASADRIHRQTDTPWISSDEAVIDLSSIDESGLWFPYFSDLSLDDPRTVPDFIERFAYRNLGTDLESIDRALSSVRSDWGVTSATPFGHEVSHMTMVMEKSLMGQARAVPIFRQGRYVGTVLQGAGYTINLGGRCYRPVSSDLLVNAIQKSDIHYVALEAIAKTLGVDADKEAVRQTTGMLQLRNILVKSWSKEKDRSAVLKNAKYLMYPGESPWPVNETTLKDAMQYISDPNFTINRDHDNMPIHHSTIFSTDVAEVVWSCFGFMAPTFRIPGGHEFSLSQEMKYEMKSSKGTVQPRDLVRVTVRNVPLPKAVADLKEVLSKKTILNPLVASKVRASQRYQDKFFAGDRGRMLYAALRQFVGINKVTNEKGKKRMIDDDEDAGRIAKRSKGAFDDEW